MSTYHFVAHLMLQMNQQITLNCNFSLFIYWLLSLLRNCKFRVLFETSTLKMEAAHYSESQPSSTIHSVRPQITMQTYACTTLELLQI